MRATRRTGTVRRSELVLVEQLALVLEVVDSARARQVGGNVDARATPAAVGRGQSVVGNAALARQTRMHSVRAAVGSGREVVTSERSHQQLASSERTNGFFEIS